MLLRCTKNLAAVAGVLVVLVIGEERLPYAHAADTTWSNTGTDFNTGGNWDNGVPGAADRAIFSGPVSVQPNLSASTTITNLQFGSATNSSSYILTSSNTSTTLTVTSTATSTGDQAIVTQNTSGTNTINAPVVLGAAASSIQTFSITSGGTLTMNGGISQLNSGIQLRKRDSGALLLTGTNSYTGGTAIEAGMLQLGDGTTNGTISSTGSVAIGSSATFAVNTTGQTISNAITGGGSVLKSGSGTLTLNSSSSSYSGGTTISLGAVTWNNDTALGSGTITLNHADTNGNTTLQRSNSGSLDNNIVVANAGSGGTATIGRTSSTGSPTSYNGTITLNKSATLANGGGTLQFNGVISGTGGVTISGNGTTIFGADNTYGGTTTINAGVLQVGSGTAGAVAGDVVNDSLLRFSRSNALTMAGTISGVGSVTKENSGTLTLTGTNTYGGGTTVTAGVLAVDNNPALGSGTGSGAVTVNNDGTLSGSGSVAGAVTLNNTGHLAAGGVGAVESLAIGVVATPVTLTFNNTSRFDYEIKSDASLTAAGDLVDLKGNLTIGATSVLNVSDVAMTAAVIAGGEKLTLISYTGTLTGEFASRPEGSTVNVGVNSFKLSYNDMGGGLNFGGGTGSKFVTLTSLAAVPEASVVVFGCAVCAVIGLRYVGRKRGAGARCKK